MEAIYDSTGGVVGWLSADRIMNVSGQHVAILYFDQAVCDYCGAQLGTFVNGHFRDGDGHAVAFIQGATAGPIPPIPQVPPVPPVPEVPPVPPIPPVPYVPPIPSFYWSSHTWDEFLGI